MKKLRDKIADFVHKKYKIALDYPWAKYPEYAVLRHSDTRKWFGLIANVACEKLGLTGDDTIDILNVKVDPMVIGGFINQDGILPAYHMNKSSWVTILLDGRVSFDDIKFLINVSYELTSDKTKGKRNV